MNKEQKQDFTRRLSQCNRGQMIVIIYDIYFAYERDIRDAHAAGEHEAFREAVHKAEDVVTELIGALDFTYPIAKELYPLYVYARNCLAKALFSYSVEPVDAAARILRPLSEAFSKAAEADDSEPLMSNAQQVYAGMTYGRESLTENCLEGDNRGFLV